MPAARPLITLLTDFGDRDYFVASMKGVILSIHPDVHIVDLSHQIASHQIEEAGYMLYSCYRSFPAGTIHVCVVDPGVGSARRAILVATSRYYFLAPDNGLLSRVLRDERDSEIRQIEAAQYRLQLEGATFDGRDLFAPAAAWLAKGEPVSSFGRVIDDPVTRSIADPIRQGKALLGQIEYVDRFGNLISNITEKHIQEFLEAAGRVHLTIHVGPSAIIGLVPSYSEGRCDTPSALINSCGKLEIFLDRNSAAQRLQIGVGGEIRLC
jgi:S-adenosylmethionine hydrolase